MAFFNWKKDEVSQASSQNDYSLEFQIYEIADQIKNGIVKTVTSKQLYELLSSEDPNLQQVGFEQSLKQPKSDSDWALLDLMQSNNPIFSQLGCTWWFQRDYNDVQRSIRHRCDGLAHSEEVASDGFYRASRNILSGRYEDQGKSLIAYPIGIAGKIIASYWRTKYKYKYNMVPIDDCKYLLCLEKDLVETQADKSDVEDFLNQLDEQKRTIFELYVFGGMSAKKVGNKFGKRAENVRKIVSRIKGNLKQHLAKS